MINIKEKADCCGCSACMNICPKKCITMEKDEEGFLYPVVDEKRCIHCGLCEKTCPIINKKRANEELQKTYAVYNKNEDIRKNSTSGGFFTSLAEKILEKQGVVFGVAFDKDFIVRHIKVEKKEELYKLRGSKYVQSIVGDTYQKVKELLEKDIYVLYSGTPCQIYGLKNFLKKDYEKLYCVDVICKGVPSPLLWEEYKKNKEKKDKIKEIYFREKTYGFNSTTMSLYYEKAKPYHKGHESDEMLNLFVKELSSRPSCYRCNFKGKERISDFTIGDCWQVEKMIPEMTDDKGTTLLIVHSKKAEELLKQIDCIKLQQIDFERALELNGGSKKSMYLESAKPNERRKEFYKDFKQLSYEKLINKYCPKTVKTKIKSNLKPILYRLGILNKIKQKMK